MKQTVKKRIRFYIKFWIGSFVRFVTRIFYIFPVKNNRVLFHAYDAKHICCNPKYIFENLMKVYPNMFEYIWVLENNEEIETYKNTGELIRTVKPRSIGFYVAKASSKVCVINSASFPEIQLRKNQFQINTYHGGGSYKTAGTATKDADSKLYLKKLEWDQKNTSLSLSSSKYFSREVIRKQMTYRGEIYEYGMPRNDILIHGGSELIVDRVKKKYHIQDTTKIALYAPTYRDIENKYEKIDNNGVLEALNGRFGGEWVLFYRTHYLSHNACENQFIVDCSDYPDMQELLCTADVLISDYSSSIWDYSFTNRPCLLFTPDLDSYISSRGLDTPIETWGFPVCRDNTELITTIKEWSEETYIKHIEMHHSTLGSCETGKATEIVCQRICDVCFGSHENKSGEI